MNKKRSTLVTATRHHLNLHDTYGVSWTDEMIARDLIQNFYDPLPRKDFGRSVKIIIDEKNKSIRLKGPTTFNIELLWRIGVGTKLNQSGRYAGEFGEGFAVAILQILRDTPGATVAFTVGVQRATFILKKVNIEEVDTRELVCVVEEADEFDGSELLLENCSESLIKAFKGGHRYFDYPNNILFGKRLDMKLTWEGLARHELGMWEDCFSLECEICGPDLKKWEEGKGIRLSEADASDYPFGVYRSKDSKGYIFYRRQLRGEIDIPFVFCCNVKVSRVNTGRDRLKLNKNEIKNILLECAKTLPSQVIRNLVLDDLRKFWVTGHPFLNALAEAWIDRVKESNIIFPDEFCASSSIYMQLETARRLGKKICPPYMAAFGMHTTKDIDDANATGHIREPRKSESKPEGNGDVEAIREESSDVDEVNGFLILGEAYQAVIGNTLADWNLLVFEPSSAKSHLEGFHESRTICLEAGVFIKSFGEAFSIFIHEAEHEYGRDGAATFSDALTFACQRLIVKRNLLSDFEERWETNRAAAIAAFTGGLPMLAGLLEEIRAIRQGKGFLRLRAMPRMNELSYKGLREGFNVDVRNDDEESVARIESLELPNGQGKIAAELLVAFGDSTPLLEADEDTSRLMVNVFRTAIRLDSNNIDAYRGLGYFIINCLDGAVDVLHAMAKEVLERGISANPESGILHADLGWIALYEDKLEDARGLFRKSLELEPDISEGHEGLALLGMKERAWMEVGEHLRLVVGIGKRRNVQQGMYFENEVDIEHPSFEPWYLELFSKLERNPADECLLGQVVVALHLLDPTLNLRTYAFLKVIINMLPQPFDEDVATKVLRRAIKEFVAETKMAVNKSFLLDAIVVESLDVFIEGGLDDEEIEEFFI